MVTETGQAGVARFAGWRDYAVTPMTHGDEWRLRAGLLSAVTGINELYAESPFRPMTRIERAKRRVADWFDAQTAAGIAVDLGVRS